MKTNIKKKRPRKRKKGRSLNKFFIGIIIIFALIIAMLITALNNVGKDELDKSAENVIEVPILPFERLEQELNLKTNDENLSEQNLKDKSEKNVKDILANLGLDITDKKPLEIDKKEQNLSVKKDSLPPKILDKNKTATKKEKKEQNFSAKPKLVIIIDDVATFKHARMIRQTGLKLTPSIFPVTKAHPNTPAIARSFEFYMIHFPMQAKSFKYPEIGTLNIGDSYESILERVRRVRRDFPRAIYVNNHTGSKFASDLSSMDKAFKALLSEKFIFVDSRTIGASVVAKVAKKYNQPYIARDVFLDVEQTSEYVKKQLELAVKIAKRRGYAIAIGHPHKVTIEAIKSSKNALLKEVEVVYLRDIL